MPWGLIIGGGEGGAAAEPVEVESLSYGKIGAGRFDEICFFGCCEMDDIGRGGERDCLRDGLCDVFGYAVALICFLVLCHRLRMVIGQDFGEVFLECCQPSFVLLCVFEDI